MALSCVRMSMTGWHNRPAHPHEAILRRLVSSFQLPVSTTSLSSVCEPCQLGKCHRFHLSSTNASCSKPFELMYSDVWVHLHLYQ